MTNFNQLDTNSDAVALLSPFSSNSASPVQKYIDATTGPGSSAASKTITAGQNGNNVADYHFRSSEGQPGSTSWEAGTWTVRINVTTGNSKVTWNGLGISCTTDAGSERTSLATLTNIGIVLSTTGVKSQSVSGSAASSGVLTSDQIQISLGFSDSSSHGGDTIGITMNQIIDTPVTNGGAPPPATTIFAQPTNFQDPGFF